MIIKQKMTVARATVKTELRLSFVLRINIFRKL